MFNSYFDITKGYLIFVSEIPTHPPTAAVPGLGSVRSGRMPSVLMSTVCA